MLSINTKEAFAGYLQKMYWIETQMEQYAIWESRIEMLGDEMEALEVLSHDSEKHGAIVEKWLKTAGISIPSSTPRGLPQKAFDFSGMDSREMFREMMKYEILAHDVYIELSNAKEAMLREVFPDDVLREQFIEDMKRIAKDEEKHTKICKNKVGGFKVIQGTHR